MRIHPVLTAHPTEARRRAVATALRRIAASLDAHDDSGVRPPERAQARRRMLEDIDILQRTSTLRITRPTPADEVKTVLTVFGSRWCTRCRASTGPSRARWATRPGAGRRCPRSCGSARGSVATATATRSSPPRSPARRWRSRPTRCCAVLHDAVDRIGPDAHRRRGVDAADGRPARRAVQRRRGPPALLAEVTKDSPDEPHRQ